MTTPRKRYETIDLNFEYNYFKGTRPMDDFIAAIKLPRKLARWSVDMRPNTTPYMVTTRDETEQERDQREDDN